MPALPAQGPVRSRASMPDRGTRPAGAASRREIAAGWISPTARRHGSACRSCRSPTPVSAQAPPAPSLPSRARLPWQPATRRRRWRPGRPGSAGKVSPPRGRPTPESDLRHHSQRHRRAQPSSQERDSEPVRKPRHGGFRRLSSLDQANDAGIGALGGAMRGAKIEGIADVRHPAHHRLTEVLLHRDRLARQRRLIEDGNRLAPLRRPPAPHRLGG